MEHWNGFSLMTPESGEGKYQSIPSCIKNSFLTPLAAAVECKLNHSSQFVHSAGSILNLVVGNKRRAARRIAERETWSSSI